jgi:hypothetical protein
VLACVALVAVEVFVAPHERVPAPIRPTLACRPISDDTHDRPPGLAAEDVCEVIVPNSMFEDDAFWGKPATPPIPLPPPSNLRK